MTARREPNPENLPLPTAGLAGQISFAFYWAHHYHVEPGWTVPSPNRRPYATLWLVLEGELQAGPSGQETSCPPGTLIAWPPEALRRARNASGREATIFTAAFNLRVWGELDFFRLYRVPTLHHVDDLQALAQPFSALVAGLAAHREAVTLEEEGWARVLVGRWLSRLEAAGQLRSAEQVDGRLAAVLAAIDTDLVADWTLDRLAELMRLSKVRIREVFVRGVGLPPMRYITLRRIAQARNLLLNTDLTAAEVAGCCGFQDPAYFSRIFHRVTGLSPLAYREQSRFRREER